MLNLTYLGMDIGSKRAKAVIIDDEKVLEKVSVNIEDLFERPKPAWAQRDPLLVWERVKAMLKEMKNIASVRSICIDATSGTIIPIDRTGMPIHKALMYNDSRAIKEADDLKIHSPKAREFEEFLPIAPYLVIPKILWLRNHVEAFKNVFKILHENDFYTFLLTGEIATSSNIAGKSHADIYEERYIEEIYKDMKIPVDIMPPIKPVGAIIGYVTSSASEETGIPEGVPVINGVTDSSAGDVSTGVCKVGQVSVAIGTTLVIHAIVDKVIPDPRKRIYYKTYFGKKYIVGGATNAGSLALDAISKLLKIPIEVLDQMAEEIPPGCDGLIAQPQWTGTRLPRSNPDMRGYFLGLTEKNCTPGHLFRSLLEGNAAVLDIMLRIVEEVTGVEVKEIRISGGCAKSDVQNQIIADITGKVVRRMKTAEPALGSAIIAAWGINKTKEIHEIASKVVKIDKEYSPKNKYREIYEQVKDKLELSMKLLDTYFS